MQPVEPASPLSLQNSSMLADDRQRHHRNIRTQTPHSLQLADHVLCSLVRMERVTASVTAQDVVRALVTAAVAAQYVARALLVSPAVAAQDVF